MDIAYRGLLRSTWRLGCLRIVALFVCAGVALTGCDRSGEHGLMMDPNGFVLGGDNPKTARPLYVGVGDSPERLIARNPYLKDFVWVPQPDDETGQMRLSLQNYSRVHYDDGDIKLEVCAYRSSVDGDKFFKRGVASVGIVLCEQPVNDYKRTLQIADDLIHQFETNNPNAENLRTPYLADSQAYLVRIGGSYWETKGWPGRVSLFTLEEAGQQFAEGVAHPKLKIDTWGQLRPVGGGYLVGVYAGKRAIVEIKVSSTTQNGDNNLTDEKRLAMRYSVYIELRLRADVDPKTLIQ